MYSPQGPDSSQSRMDPYATPGMYAQPGAAPYPYPPVQQGGAPYSYPPQGMYPPPGANPYAQQGAYPPPGISYPYAPQGAYMPQKIANPRANRAMIYGIISVFLAFITLIQAVGAAGAITGTFAIIYGFTSLKMAKQLPGNTGRAQAITGIVLGFAAWFLVIISLVARSMVQ